MKIVADDKIPFLRGVLEDYAQIIYLPGTEITIDKIRDADALLVRTRTKCNGQLLHGTKVRFIGTATIGFDHIDTEYCEKNGIKWSNAPGCNSSSVQQYIAAALFKIAARFHLNLHEQTLGIIGVGNVGSKVALFAESIGMKVLLNDPPRARREGETEFTNIDDLLHNSDIVTVHVPLILGGEDTTWHLFDDCTFNKMKSGAFFINTSRGEVVEAEVLKNMLTTSRLGGVVLDVWENEPEIDHDLLSMVFLATPHIAGYSTDGKANGTAMVVNSLCRFFNLPVENWYPDKVPLPPFPEILIDGAGKKDETIIAEAILHTYNIMADDEKLRRSVSGFEKQRGEYPLRREFPFYSVKPFKCSESSLKALRRIGFVITG